LRVYNEFVVLLSSHLLIAFSDAYDLELEFKNQLGWFFVGLISLQIVVNLAITAIKAIIIVV
jgi:hypothetical protein